MLGLLQSRKSSRNVQMCFARRFTETKNLTDVTDTRLIYRGANGGATEEGLCVGATHSCKPVENVNLGWPGLIYTKASRSMF